MQCRSTTNKLPMENIRRIKMDQRRSSAMKQVQRPIQAWLLHSGSAGYSLIELLQHMLSIIIYPLDLFLSSSRDQFQAMLDFGQAMQLNGLMLAGIVQKASSPEEKIWDVSVSRMCEGTAVKPSVET
ncbi:uncharacterized protein LOC123200883 [Mangifera indica]|uniref:uncharacterized protein LOC123200883 n=1 Tax=Mangifera indica TaxID=29780 RepID=UPI001CF99BD9|nr:uncharacterized protein LOC123200883 [Mangifera indica]